jgi:hypothetical protein
MCELCDVGDYPVTLVLDNGESIAGYRLFPLGHDRWIVTDNPLTGDRFFAHSFGPAYFVESEGPSDLQTF